MKANVDLRVVRIRGEAHYLIRPEPGQQLPAWYRAHFPTHSEGEPCGTSETSHPPTLYIPWMLPDNPIPLLDAELSLLGRKESPIAPEVDKAADSGLRLTVCSPSYCARKRLLEASMAFLAAGVIIGCAASSVGPTIRNVAYGLAALWVMIAYWRIVRLNNLENSTAQTPPEFGTKNHG